MEVKEKIRKLVAEKHSEGYANACEIWKGWGELGQHPYGWWLKPFGQNARWIGETWEEVKKLW